jgi:Tfp pilus assembly protein PilF
LTGATWRSFFVAALFGWHPLRVESVAWVAERKDVLSVFFGLLSLIFYVRFVEQKGAGSKQQGTPISLILAPYFLSLFFFALGLMSKAMLVTWPFVMLLLDWWPLERFKVQGSRFKVQGLILEKVPFFALAAVMSMVTYEVQNQGGAVQLIENLPVNVRLGNALISYCRYLGKLFWPADLAVFYPHPGHWPMAGVMLACGPLVVVTMVLVMIRRRYPFLLMGWLWYIGTLVPVIGLVQVGDQAMADRYTYIPSVGVLILVVWGAYELTRRWRYQPTVLGVAGLVVVVLCLGMTRQQLGYWRDNESLFRHALAVTENNYLAYYNLANNLTAKGQTDEAINQYLEVIRLKPDYAEAYNNLGNALFGQGQTAAAIRQYLEVIRLKPDYAEAYNNLGTAFLRQGQIAEAVNQYQQAIRLKPDFVEAHYNLGNALSMKGRIDEAINQYRETIRLKPDYAEAHNNLGTALGGKGQTDAAIVQFQEAIRLKPDFTEAHSNLARALAIKNAPGGR